MNKQRTGAPSVEQLRNRVRFGAQRGAVVGAFLFALVWLRAVTQDSSAPSVRTPIAAATALIVGFAVAGGLMLGAKHHVRSLLAAIALAVGCSLPVWWGILLATAGFSLHLVPFLGVFSLLSGVIWGTMSWNAKHD
jgi:hypothetical protein